MPTCFRFCALCLAAPGIVVAIAPAAAQSGNSAADYPRRPIRVIVPFTPGGQPDIYIRLILPLLADSFGQPIVVDNRPGAGGTIGARIVAEAAPDGYTLLSSSTAHPIAPFVRKLPYDPIKSFAGITRTYSAPYLLVVPMSLSAHSVKDLIALAKAKPGTLNFASAGSGSGSGTHFAGEMLKYSAKMDVVHVGFRGIPEALTDIAAGRVQFFMAPVGSAAQLVRDGRIRALGVSSLKRSASLLEVPTIAESGLPGFDWTSWGSLLAPARTPRILIDRWNEAVRRAVTRPEIVKHLAAIGMDAEPCAPHELMKLLQEQMDVVGKLAKAAGIEPR
ncbi:MAG: tripartite tricarboxylate transporter substrate binding protein [Betaproteobacteria bacterium]|nr:tripartite tricarboxylate transporter substrate binding protein [Betaproteobacteria bacterium]